MTIEDTILSLEGIDVAKVHQVIEDVDYLLTVIKTVLPRVERTVATAKQLIEQFEAKQKSIGGRL